jgi:hypothetical protein
MSYFLFLSIGVILLLVAIVLKLLRQELGYEVFLNLGISVIAVTVVEYIWKQVGGDPISRAIDRLRIATLLLGDLEGTGIERIYSERQDSDARMWHQRVAAASEVDLMSLCLSRDWLLRPEFRETIERAAGERRTRYRILVLDPRSELASQRAREEEKKEFLPTIEQSLATLMGMRKRLGAEIAGTYFQIKVANRANVYCRIIRADDMMLVTKYLCHSSGGTSPTLELHGKDTSWFRKFTDEFEYMWELASEWPPAPKITSDGGES